MNRKQAREFLVNLMDAREKLAKHFYEEEADQMQGPMPPWEKKDPRVIHSITSAYEEADKILDIMFPEEK